MLGGPRRGPRSTSFEAVPLTTLDAHAIVLLPGIGRPVLQPRELATHSTLLTALPARAHILLPGAGRPAPRLRRARAAPQLGELGRQRGARGLLRRQRLLQRLPRPRALTKVGCPWPADPEAAPAAWARVRRPGSPRTRT